MYKYIFNQDLKYKLELEFKKDTSTCICQVTALYFGNFQRSLIFFPSSLCIGRSPFGSSLGGQK